jgi:hypothetical protein
MLYKDWLVKFELADFNWFAADGQPFWPKAHSEKQRFCLAMLGSEHGIIYHLFYQAVHSPGMLQEWKSPYLGSLFCK